MKRRTLIQSFCGLAGLGLSAGLYAWQIEPFWLEFVKLKMPIKNLPKELVGKTLMQISDIHIGKKFDHKFIIESFKKAAKFEPDIVVYTGDYVSSHNYQVMFDYLQEVLEQSVKGKLGTLGVLGNHDYGEKWSEQRVSDDIVAMLTKHGITVLKNQQIDIGGLNFIGFDDYWGLNFEPKKAMANFDKSKATIVLCHNPDVCDLNIWGDYDSWILSGHTHGGQVEPPFLPAPVLPVKNRNYTAGKIELSNNRTLYINRALGHLIQIRLNVRPEITIFELAEG